MAKHDRKLAAQLAAHGLSYNELVDALLESTAQDMARDHPERGSAAEAKNAFWKMVDAGALAVDFDPVRGVRLRVVAH
jgi:hypothetical protein